MAKQMGDEHRLWFLVRLFRVLQRRRMVRISSGRYLQPRYVFDGIEQRYPEYVVVNASRNASNKTKYFCQSSSIKERGILLKKYLTNDKYEYFYPHKTHCNEMLDHTRMPTSRGNIGTGYKGTQMFLSSTDNYCCTGKHYFLSKMNLLKCLESVKLCLKCI